HSFPTRRSSDLLAVDGHQPGFAALDLDQLRRVDVFLAYVQQHQLGLDRQEAVAAQRLLLLIGQVEVAQRRLRFQRLAQALEKLQFALVRGTVFAPRYLLVEPLDAVLHRDEVRQQDLAVGDVEGALRGDGVLRTGDGGVFIGADDVYKADHLAELVAERPRQALGADALAQPADVGVGDLRRDDAL